MTRRVSVFIIGMLVLNLLTSCALFRNNQEENREAMCKELNHRMIFNGATPNQSVAMQERAEMETLTKDYRAEGCS